MTSSGSSNCVGNPIVTPRVMVDFNEISHEGVVLALAKDCLPVMPGERVITHDDGQHECDGVIVNHDDRWLLKIWLDMETWR